MSSTSSSCTSCFRPPVGGARERLGCLGIVRATKTLPSGPYQAGMRCPHQSWRLMHQGWMSRIQAKNVFSHCRGTNAVVPASTAAIAGRASSAALQNHCVVSSGSIGTPERSPCGT